MPCIKLHHFSRELNHTEAFDIPMAQEMRSNVIILLEKCGFLCFKAESHCVCILDSMSFWLLFSFYHYFKIYTEHRIINYRNDQDSEHAHVTSVRWKDSSVWGLGFVARLTMPVTPLINSQSSAHYLREVITGPGQEAGWELEEAKFI